MKLRKKFSEYKERAIELRKEGNTYKDIRTSLNVPVSKSTLSTWFSDVLFSIEEKEKIAARCIERIRLGNKKALETKKIARDKYLQEIRKGLVPLGEYLNNSGVQKIVLIALYWCEGAKRRAGSLSFGNSDPELIRLFLKLMRSCYPIEEGKFRCTVLCRADQNTEELKLYWSKITMISPKQFYPARVDPRTIGKPTRKPGYKGVCSIDYFSARIYHELMAVDALFF